jgi:hypothetical protein
MLATISAIAVAVNETGSQPRLRIRSRAGSGWSVPIETRIAPRGTALLQWDDGSIESGVGPEPVSGQALMRFGGGTETVGLAGPGIRPIGMSWSIFTTGFPNPGPDLADANIHIWDEVGGLPNALVFSAAAPRAVNTFNSQMFSNAPAFHPANESFFAGIGAVAAGAGTPWYIAVDAGLPRFERHFFGEGATTAHSLGPTTLSNLGVAGDFAIRVLVDAGVPVELLATGPGTSGASRTRRIGRSS